MLYVGRAPSQNYFIAFQDEFNSSVYRLGDTLRSRVTAHSILRISVVIPFPSSTFAYYQKSLMMWPFVPYPECSPEDVDGKTYDYIVVGGKGGLTFREGPTLTTKLEYSRWDSWLCSRFTSVRKP